MMSSRARNLKTSERQVNDEGGREVSQFDLYGPGDKAIVQFATRLEKVPFILQGPLCSVPIIISHEIRFCLRVR